MTDAIKKSLHGLYRAANRRLAFAEQWYAGGAADRELPFPPIFILGAPRCGSTLLYQTLSAVLDVTYLSNAHCHLHGSPWLVERWMNPSKRYRPSKFRSRFGITRGAAAPSECWEYWYRFFPEHPQYAPLDACDPEKLAALRRSVSAMVRAADKPILIKNLVNVLRLEALIQTLPESLFIVLHRDPVDTGHSILESRKKRHGSYDAWFSLEPPEVEELKQLPPARQVAGQIRAVRRLIDETEERHPGRFHRLEYERFCSDPESAVQGIRSFLEDHRVKVSLTGPIPDRFERRSEVRIDPDLHRELKQEFNQTDPESR